MLTRILLQEKTHYSIKETLGPDSNTSMIEEVLIGVRKEKCSKLVKSDAIFLPHMITNYGMIASEGAREHPETCQK